jgi:hypothetical protein
MFPPFLVQVFSQFAGVELVRLTQEMACLIQATTMVPMANSSAEIRFDAASW